MLRERSGHALSLSGHDPAGSVSKKRRHFGPNPEMESRTVSTEKQFNSYAVGTCNRGKILS